MSEVIELKDHFKGAADWRLTLPNSYHFKEVLSPQAMETMKSNYGVFVNTMKERLEKFLESNGEKPKIATDMIFGVFGPSEAGLEFRARAHIVNAFRESAEDIFKDLPLNPALVEQGASWKNLQIDKFENGIMWGLY